jgi:hypothetical protein
VGRVLHRGNGAGLAHPAPLQLVPSPNRSPMRGCGADHVILCRKICQTALRPTIMKAILSCSPKRCPAASQPKNPCSPSCNPAARIRTNVKKSISPLIIALAPDECKETPTCGVPGSPCYAEAQTFPRPCIGRDNCLPNHETDPRLIGHGTATVLHTAAANPATMTT